MSDSKSFEKTVQMQRLKEDIIFQYQNGKSVAEIASFYHLNQSFVYSVLLEVASDDSSESSFLEELQNSPITQQINNMISSIKEEIHQKNKDDS